MSIEIIYRDDYEDVADTYHITIGAEAMGTDALAAFIRVMRAVGYSDVTICRALEEQVALCCEYFDTIAQECCPPPTVTVPDGEAEAEAVWREFTEILEKLKEKCHES